MENTKVNVFKISREWFDWCFNNPELVKPAHGSLYFFAIDQNNRFGWKEKFGLPALHAMEATGIKSKNTYYKAFNDLVDWNFIKLIKKSTNQNSANVISIPAVQRFKSAPKKPLNSALDLANIQQEHTEGNIDKQRNNKLNNLKQENKLPLAYEFLKREIPQDLQNFEAQNKSKIKNWLDLIYSFNDTIEIEVNKGKLDFEANQLFPRLRKYYRSWLNIQDAKKDIFPTSQIPKNGNIEPTINRQTADVIRNNSENW